MARDHERNTGSQRNSLATWSRRNLLKYTGIGDGMTALGGTGVVGAAEEQDDDDGSDDRDDDGHFVGDLVDPVFGYALATNETDDVSLENVVELHLDDGEGHHEDFPQEPDEEAPGQFVEIPAEFYFEPAGLHVEPDVLVHFNNISSVLHTVTAFHEKFGVGEEFQVPSRVPDGVQGFTSPPITAGESWIYGFSIKGVYDYLCFPHLGLGMVGRLVVFDPDEDDIDDDTFAAPSNSDLFPNVERVLSADELDPQNIVDAGSASWDDLSLDS